MKNLLNQAKSFLLAHRNQVYLGLIIFLGSVLRFYDLGTESFFEDEIFTIHLVSLDLPAFIHRLITEGVNIRSATYFILAHFWVMFFQINEFSIRSLSVIFGVLSIIFMYLIGRQLFGVKIGLISSFLMAVSEYQIEYSQGARFYSLFVLLTLLSIYCFILALKTKKPSHWILSSLFNILLFYTHSYAIFIFAAEYIYFFIYWKSHKNILIQWVLSQLLIMLAIIPSFISMMSGVHLTAGLTWIPTPTIKDFVRTVYNYLFPQNYQHSWLFIAASFAVGIAFFILSALLFNFRKVKSHWLSDFKNRFQISRNLFDQKSEYALVGLWFLCPILLPFLYSIIFPPIFQDRYTICAAPAFYLLVSVAISRVRRYVPIYISLIALMIVVLPGLQDYYLGNVNEQWREAAAYVQEFAQANDTIIFAPDEQGYQHLSFNWYFHASIPECGISSEIKDESTIGDIKSNCISGHERYWVIMKGTPEVVNFMKSFFLNPDKTTFRLAKEQEFVRVSVYLFELN